MHTGDDMVIRVHGAWNGWRNAEVRLRDLQNVHWLQPERAPRRLLHGHVLCSCIIAGEIPHNCRRTEAPHTLLVCVLKRHNAPSVYAELIRRADTSATACASVATGTLDPVSESNGVPVRLISMRIRGNML